MSFSGEVKQELCRIRSKKCCKKAELAGIMAFCGIVSGADFVLKTENELVAQRIQELFGTCLLYTSGFCKANCNALLLHMHELLALHFQ